MIKVYKPSPLLADFISCFWSLENFSGQQTELVYPTGKIQLIFHFRKPFTDTDSSGNEIIQPRYALCGQKTSYSHITASSDSGMIAAVFRTHGASAFFPIPLNDITDYTVSFTDIFKDWINIQGEFDDCIDDTSRISIISNFLFQKINTSPICHDYFIRSCVEEIIQNKGVSAPVHSMERFGYSERSLQRIFRERVGLTPKKFSGIVRFENTIPLFRKGWSMTDICLKSGYYDQPHFINSFRKLTGLTPSEFEIFITPADMSDFYNT